MHRGGGDVEEDRYLSLQVIEGMDLYPTLVLAELSSKTFIPNGWGKRNRNLPIITNSKKRFGRSRVNGLLTL